MANREKGEVDVTLDGKVYTLVLRTNELVALEAVLSTPVQRVRLPEVVYEIAMGSMTHIRAFLWASMRKHHKDVTLEAVGDLIDRVGGGEKVLEAISAVKESLYPDQADVEKVSRPRKPRRTRGTGAASTSTLGASA